MDGIWTPYPLGSAEIRDEYCVNARGREISYLLSLEPGRLLAGFYLNAGLKTPFVRYGGWEDSLIGGHTLGHYLTAVSQAYAAERGAAKEELKRRIETVTKGLSACQRAVGSGLIWGAKPAASGGIEAQFDHVECGKTNIEREAWVPWYTLHKLLAGLLDEHRLAGSERALEIAEALGGWVCRRTAGWTPRVRRKVLSVEYGGMNDCLYELYARTGNADYAAAARRFDDEKLYDAILSGAPGVLKDKHANEAAPKTLGALNRYVTDRGARGAVRYLHVAERFFAMVTERHTYVTGGAGEWEHFGADYVLDAERTNCNCETCVAYNLLKLARGLFCETGDVRYLDYYDNAFTNSILASQNPKTGMTTYFQPMASGFFKVFSRPYDKFWCCTGSGMESFTKLSDGIFYVCGEKIAVARYLSSSLKTERVSLTLACNFPLSDTARLRVLSGGAKLLLRIPDWCAGEPVLERGGKAVGTAEGRFLAVEVAAGDELTLRIPVSVTLSGLPDAPDVFAFRYGGAVLSADLGTEDMEETETGVAVTIPKRRIPASELLCFDDVGSVLADPAAYLVREGDEFELHGADVPLRFGLHYRRYRERYGIYFRFAEYLVEDGKRVKGREEKEREPLDTVQPGYGQYETDELHALEERGSAGATADGTYRFARARGWFSYDFRVDPEKQNVLRIALRCEDNGKPLRISAGGEKFFSERLLYTMGEERYLREIAIPKELVARRARRKTAAGETVTVLRIRFEGSPDRASAKLCDFIRIFAE